jgi:hypothetical protein
VFGLLNVRNRLRTRVQPFTSGGKTINGRLFPVTPGPGGSWIIFDRIVFEDYFVGLDHDEIKEYTKIRLQALASGELDGAKYQAELDIIEEAMRNLQNDPYAESSMPLAIGNRKIVPKNHENDSRLKSKHRRTGSAIVPLVVPL